jgi:hypothetical protein
MANQELRFNAVFYSLNTEYTVSNLPHETRHVLGPPNCYEYDCSYEKLQKHKAYLDYKFDISLFTNNDHSFIFLYLSRLHEYLHYLGNLRHLHSDPGMTD